MNPVEMMYINKRRRSRKIRRGQHGRVQYKNPLINIGSPGRRSSRSGGSVNLITDLGLTAAGTIANLIIPSKVMGLTGPKKFLVQAGIMLGTGTLLRGLLGAKVGNRLALGAGVGLGITLINDLILKQQGKEVLADENEIPVLSLSAELIPEIEAGSGEDETVIIPEDISSLEPEMSAEEFDGEDNA